MQLNLIWGFAPPHDTPEDDGDGDVSGHEGGHGGGDGGDDSDGGKEKYVSAQAKSRELDAGRANELHADLTASKQATGQVDN